MIRLVVSKSVNGGPLVENNFTPASEISPKGDIVPASLWSVAEPDTIVSHNASSDSSISALTELALSATTGFLEIATTAVYPPLTALSVPEIIVSESWSSGPPR